MQTRFALIILTILTIGIQAKEVDITVSKGTEQSLISSLAPTPSSYDADQNMTLTAVFSVPLDVTSVQKNNVKLKKITQSQPFMIEGVVAYDANKNAVTFRPSTLLSSGYYEVEFKSLKATKTNKDQHIKEIKYRFYVPEVINGYKLPLEPNKALNDSTLLGIDSNKNGVRDDVERYVIKTYKDEKIAIEIGFQLARAYNVVIEDPANAKETTKIIEDAQDCEGYFRVYAKIFKEDFYLENEVMSKQFKSMNLNTEERIRSYLEYNSALSGGVFTLEQSIKNMKKKCSFDVEQMLKDRK